MRKIKYDIFIGILLLGFSIERFFVWDNPLRPETIISGILGAILLSLTFIYISRKYIVNSDRTNNLNSIFTDIIYLLILLLFSSATVFIQFLPLIFSNENNTTYYKTFLTDIGFDISGYKAQFFESIKDIIWCTFFVFFVMYLRKRIDNKTISYRHTFNIIVLYIVLLIILLPFLTISAGFHKLFQIEYLLIFFLILLIIQSHNIIEMKLNTIGNIFYNRKDFITMSISSGGDSQDVPSDHRWAFMNIFVKFMNEKMKEEKNIYILDFGGGRGAICNKIMKVKKWADQIEKYFIVDINQEAISVAKKELKNVKVSIESGDILKYNSEEKFNIIIMNQVIQFINTDKYETLFNNIYNLLKEYGFLLIVDEFPQQAPSIDDTASLEKRLQIYLALHPVDKDFIIKNAEGCKFIKMREYSISLHRDQYHPPITGLLFEKNQ